MSGQRNTWLGLLALGMALSASFWLLQSPADEAYEPGASSRPKGSQVARSPSQPAHGEVQVGEEQVDSVQPDATQVAPPPLTEGPQRPHPITPIHEELAKQRELIAALEDALQHKRYDQARQLLGEADDLARAATTDAVFGESVRGYRLILECLAARTSTDGRSGSIPEALRQDSQKYLDTHRLSPRREVRRVCLEGRPFARRA